LAEHLNLYLRPKLDLLMVGFSPRCCSGYVDLDLQLDLLVAGVVFVFEALGGELKIAGCFSQQRCFVLRY
jgi:hypothetical protein